MFFVIETLCVYCEVGTGFLYNPVLRISSETLCMFAGVRNEVDGFLLLLTRRHGVISRKTRILSNTSVKTSNLAVSVAEKRCTGFSSCWRYVATLDKATAQ
jgi:hypothetical protein